ncbi:MAG: histone H1-like repetitive region-containing protein [Promethearchaeota archaeon]
MSESIPKEIIGIAQASEWNHIKQFLKALLELTIDKKEEYSLIALNASINNKKHEEYDVQIKTKAQIKLLSSITDFEKISLYQYSEYKRNIINLSKDKKVIVLTAQYMGPEIDHTNYFDFAIYLDSFDLPYFSDNKGNVYECHEIMGIISKFKPEAPKKIKKRESPKKPETYKIEIDTYERLTEKNAIWGNPPAETKSFQKWKMRTHKQFRDETGGLPYYKGKTTQRYELYLNDLSGKPVVEKITPKKPKVKKTTEKKPAKKKPVAKKEPVAKKATAKKPAKKKPVAKKEPVAKKAIAKKPAKKKPVSKKEPVAKKAIAKKPAKKKPVAKKEPVAKKVIAKKSAKKKPVAKKKVVAKKSTAKKPAKKKSVAKEKPVAKKSTAKKSPVKKAPPKKSVSKKSIKEPESSNLEAKIYEKLTGKNAIYGGKITKAFENWKLKMHKGFEQKVGGKPYYKGNLTQKYEKYISSL